MEQANYMGNFNGQQWNPKSNTYRPSFRNHPNFSYRNTQNVLNPPPGFVQQEKKSSLEEMFYQFMLTTKQHMDDTNQYMAKTDTLLSSQAAAIKNLEVQMGQLARSSSSKQQGSFPSDTITNPKEQCKAISTRSGLQLQDPPMKSSVEKKQLTDKDDASRKVREEIEKQELSVVKHEQRILFPHILQKKNLDKQFAKFLEVFKKFHINIPFAKALAQMPTYTKFIKGHPF